MAKRKITELVEEELNPFLEQNGYELFYTEYVKEGKDWFLRIFIDSEKGISIEDCEIVNRFIGEKLDELNPIERAYFLEVSSAGLDRPLIKDSDYEKYKGRLVDIFLYKARNGEKIISGELVGLIDDQIIINNIKKEAVEIPRELASKVKLAVVF